MCMMTSIVEEVATLSPMQDTEAKELTTLLEKVREQAYQLPLIITKERWVAMGVHLLAFMRRVQNQEKLPAVDSSLIEEGDVRLKQISQKVLEAYGFQYGFPLESIEIFLLQVHLEAAKAVQEETN